MLVRTILGLCLLAFAPSAASWAQTFQVINLDPGLVVSDINNDLVGVGTHQGGPAPFILRPTGIQLFPDLRQLRPVRVNNSGVIAGEGSLTSSVANGLFVVDSGGSAYAAFAGPTLVSSIAEFTDTGLMLIFSIRVPGSSLSPPMPFVWDGANFYPIHDTYELPLPTTTFLQRSGAFINAIGADGAVGGSLDGEPFLKQRNQPLVHPWQGGQVSRIGPAGDVVGLDSAGTLIRRQANGSLQTFPALGANPIASNVNRSGDIVGSYFNGSNGRREAFVVRGGEVIYLTQHFSSMGEYLSAATDITDSGVILGEVSSAAAFAHRQVLLMPALEPPTQVTSSVNGRFVSVSWQPAVGANEYLVEAGSRPGASDFFNGSAGAQLSIAGTVPPGRYYVRIRSRNIAGASAPSADVLIEVF